MARLRLAVVVLLCLSAQNLARSDPTTVPGPGTTNDPTPAGSPDSPDPDTVTPVSNAPTPSSKTCLAGRWIGLDWPETTVGTTARLKCLLSNGVVTRLCSLKRYRIPFIGEFERAAWELPDFRGCASDLWDDDWNDWGTAVPLPVTQAPPACPRDTSYATTWPETPVNAVASAQCPENLGNISADVQATRHCAWSNVDGQETATWQEADLIDCIAAALNSSYQQHTDQVQSALNEWIADNSCNEDITTSISGYFAWNETVIGGLSTASCSFGVTVPPDKVRDFLQASLRLASALEKLSLSTAFRANVSGDGNETGHDWNGTWLDVIAVELAEFLDDFLSANATREDVLSGFAEWLETRLFLQDLGGRWEEISTLIFGKHHPINPDSFKWIGQAAEQLMLPEKAVIGQEPGGGKGGQQLTYDLRRNGPEEETFSDSRKSLNAGLAKGFSAPASGESWRPLLGDGDAVTSTPEHNSTTVDGQGGQESQQMNWNWREILESFQFPNISSILDAFHSMSRKPTRKCWESFSGDGVAWEEADTWMCRSENGSFSEDLERAMKANHNFGLKSVIDVSFFKILLKLWHVMDTWASGIPQSTVAMVQVINFILALPEPLLPQLWNNKIILKIEDLARQPLPDNVSSVTIVTENMVVTMEEIEQGTFEGSLFASINPTSQADSSHTTTSSATSKESNIGSNAFRHIDGALNDSLQGLDLGLVDEYFYVPEDIFSHDHEKQCDNNDEANGTAPSLLKSTLQFVIYENDQLFRADTGHVPVAVPGSSASDWQVASRVISASLGGRCVWGLDQPVVFNLRHHGNIKDHEMRQCVYWDFKARGGLGTWSTEGCTVTSQSEKSTVCECNHLTNYAVIIDIWDQLGKGDLSEANSLALEVISYVGCSLSLIGLIITAGMLISVGKMRAAKTTPPRLMLCISLIVSMTFYLTGVDRTDDRNACLAFACCIHYFTLVALFWMAAEGVFLLRNVVLVTLGPSGHLFRNCCLFAWGVPAVIVGLVLIFNMDAYGDEHRCWISDEVVFFTAFFTPAISIVVFNSVIFGLVMSVLYRRPLAANCYGTGKEKRALLRRRKEVFGIVSLTAVLGLTWIFGSFSFGEGVRVASLYLFTIFNSAQGFFIFLFYGVISFAGTRRTLQHGGGSLVRATPDKWGQLARCSLVFSWKILQLQLVGWAANKRQAELRQSVSTTCTDCDSGKEVAFATRSLNLKDDSKVLDVKMGWSFLASAGILHTQNQCNISPGNQRDHHGDPLPGNGAKQSERFVVGPGIVFCGKSPSQI